MAATHSRLSAIWCITQGDASIGNATIQPSNLSEETSFPAFPRTLHQPSERCMQLRSSRISMMLQGLPESSGHRSGRQMYAVLQKLWLSKSRETSCDDATPAGCHELNSISTVTCICDTELAE